jgi:hypothetical protein
MNLSNKEIKKQLEGKTEAEKWKYLYEKTEEWGNDTLKKLEELTVKFCKKVVNEERLERENGALKKQLERLAEDLCLLAGKKKAKK